MAKPVHSHINLALQGGGAHGAFTWGVLDGLLEDETLDFGWLSGTSAGAVNAVAMASGLAAGGRHQARAKLRSVWAAVEKAKPPDLMALNPYLTKTMESMAKLMSPYDFNPMKLDPFRDLLLAEIDFPRLRLSSPMEMLIAATDVATGRPRLFRRHEMRVEVVIASACLPTVHHPVQIDGRAYWDGGFSANPDLVTLAKESPVEDTLIVVLNQAKQPKLPKTVTEIATQMSEITFNQPFLRDVELIAAARGARLSWLGRVRGPMGRLQRHRFHVIEAGRHTANLASGTKMRPDAELLSYLFSAGRTEAAKWLGTNRKYVGIEDTAELEARYLGAPAHRRR